MFTIESQRGARIGRGVLRLITFSACLAVAAARPAAAAAQLPDTIPARQADRLAGLYRLDNGELVHVTNLMDAAGGRPILTLTEYASGRSRALYPTGPGAFEAGPAWFSRAPAVYQVQFSGDSVFSLTEAGRVREARRAALAERPVAFISGGDTLSGTLILPSGAGPWPALLSLHGSGPVTRRVPRQFGDLVAARGVAVLVYDRPGTGRSTGAWQSQSHSRWLREAAAALDALKREPGIDTSRIGVLAVSESGFVGPVLAAERSDVRFLVCRVCSALPHGETIQDMEERRLLRQGRDTLQAAEAREWLRRRIDFALRGAGWNELVAFEARTAAAPWRAAFPPGAATLPGRDAAYWSVYRALLEVNPAQAWSRLRVPALILPGELDDRIHFARHRPVFEAIAQRAGVTLRVVAGADHGLMVHGPDGAIGYPAGLMEEVAGWIARAAGVRGAGPGLPTPSH